MDVKPEIAVDEMERTLRSPGWTLIREHLARVMEGRLAAMSQAQTEYALIRAAADIAALKSLEPTIRGYVEVLKKEANPNKPSPGAR